VDHDIFSNGQNLLGTFPLESCQIVAYMLRGSYGESSVMDFGKTCYGKVANLLRTSYGEICVMDFGLYTTDRLLRPCLQMEHFISLYTVHFIAINI